jgi:hypothetical protein
MSSKLTLSIEKGVIAAAKEYASAQGRSLSNIVEEYLKSLGSREKIAMAEEPQAAFHPLIEELAGSIKFPKGKTDEELLGEARMDKYLKS